MGLDATVFCNCFELGLLKTPPLTEWGVYVVPEGHRDCASDLTSERKDAFYAWSDVACEHEDGVALHHRIGNISGVAALREELSRAPEQFPLLLSKVLYNGTHAGDWLDVPTVEALQPELKHLSGLHAQDVDGEWFLRQFEQQMRELVACALNLRKPIVF